YVRVAPGTSEQALGDVYEHAYAGATFVRLVGQALPEIKHVAHTNFCDIGWRVDPSGRAILVSVIDNLVKGAAGQAGQDSEVGPGRSEHECDARHRRADGAAVKPLVVKFGGELLEDGAHLATAVRALGRITRNGRPLVVVHGGGREIDAALTRAGIEKRQVDGLRITDQPTLDVVVAGLAGSANARVVAALNAAGIAAVGLTGADGLCGLAAVAAPHRAVDGRIVDLDRVGIPDPSADMRLLQTLTHERFVPVIACIGITRDGQL